MDGTTPYSRPTIHLKTLVAVGVTTYVAPTATSVGVFVTYLIYYTTIQTIVLSRFIYNN